MSAAGSDFWSRRRAAVQAEEAALAVVETRREAQALALAQEEKPDSVILDELGLKDPDLMQAGDDFAAFMQAAVPERLRRRALRRLWRSNPVLANLDGLVDHGEDYSAAATVVAGMTTRYQVGKGLLQHVLERAEAADPAAVAPARAGLADAPGAADLVAATTDAQADVAPLADGMAGDGAAPDMAQVEADDLPVLPAPRHMRFRFEA